MTTLVRISRGIALGLSIFAPLVLSGACGSDDSGAAPATVSEAGADGADGADAGIAELTHLVDPFIGTDDSSSTHPVPGGAGGSTYPGAVVPFGMVQLSPDTPTASPSGYRFKDTKIEQFSVTHFDGAGCPNNEDIPFLPFVGNLTESPGGTWSHFASGYTKSSESASPGYYAVDLDRYGVRVELTATTRTGFARFTFPASSTARLLLHAGLSATGARAGSVQIVAPDKVQGTAGAGGFCGSTSTFPIYFVATFDQPFTDVGTWVGATLNKGATSASGTGVGAFVTFDTSTSPIVNMKIGLSYVSIKNAQANLDAEGSDRDFDAVHAQAVSRWNEVLNRIQIDGGSDDDRKKFYTALYHVMQNPNVASDVNGQYAGFDGAVHTASRITYQNYSGWDIIRSWTHLVSAIAPEAPDIIASMVQDGVEGGLLPFWSQESVETHVMVGDPGTVNVANAYAMGVRGFDTAAALRLMKSSADDPNQTQRWALSDWINLHYVGNAATSLEYAMADFALGKYAEALGDTASAQKYLARSDYWRESFKAGDNYIEPRVGTPMPGAIAARLYEVQVFGPSAPATDLALGKTATASGSCSANEGPEKAVNGTYNGGGSDKWCDNASANKWWQVDLGSAQSLDKVVLYHAGAGGESTNWDTQDFTIAVSSDANTWTTVATVTGNKNDVSTHTFGATSARYVKIAITAPIQGGTQGAWDCQPFLAASECGFIEGNGAQYVWMVPHDLEGLLTSMGGHATAVNRLDTLFQQLNAGTNQPYFYIGNEPEHGTPWTYNFAGSPDKTRAVVRRIVDEEFSTGPGGLPGNDDLGATSAWLVWAYLGLYPVIPGTDVLVVHGPYFPSATVHLANGNTLRITATGDSAGAPYVQSLAVNGAATTKSWLRFADLSPGATLDYALGPASTGWGTAASDLPPSFPP